MDFEWDPRKAAANLTKHGIDFVTAAQVLASGVAFEYPSDRGSETRWVAIGAHPMSGRVIAIVYTTRGDTHRIISARRAWRHEEEEYSRRTGG